jgi:hypothetical protein
VAVVLSNTGPQEFDLPVWVLVDPEEAKGRDLPYGIHAPVVSLSENNFILAVFTDKPAAEAYVESMGLKNHEIRELDETGFVKLLRFTRDWVRALEDAKKIGGVMVGFDMRRKGTTGNGFLARPESVLKALGEEESGEEESTQS